MRLRIVSWNVHSWRDSFFRDRFTEMLAILIGLRPQVLCIQEARWDPEMRIYSYELSTLRDKLDLSAYALAQTHLSPIHKQATGLCIFLNGEITSKSETEIGRFFGIRRKILSVEARFQQSVLTIATAHVSPVPWPTATHLKWEWLPRPRETQRLVDAISSLSQPLILAVDLNAPPESKEYQRLRSVLKEPGRFHATHTSGLCVDYFFVSPEIDISMISPGLASSPSDHYPIAAEVNI